MTIVALLLLALAAFVTGGLFRYDDGHWVRAGFAGGAGVAFLLLALVVAL